MSDPIKTIQVGDLTVKIYPDENPENPREDEGNLTEMVCFHRRYNLGDKDHGFNGDKDHGFNQKDFTTWDGLQKGIIKKHNPFIILPLWMLDHSGLTISTTDEFFRQMYMGMDHGRIGWVFISRQKALEAFSAQSVTKKYLEKNLKTLQDVLQAEVKVYNQYLRGDVYSYDIEDKNGYVIGSSNGYFGLDYCEEISTEEAQGYIPTNNTANMFENSSK